MLIGVPLRGLPASLVRKIFSRRVANLIAIALLNLSPLIIYPSTI